MADPTVTARVTSAMVIGLGEAEVWRRTGVVIQDGPLSRIIVVNLKTVLENAFKEGGEPAGRGRVVEVLRALGDTIRPHCPEAADYLESAT